MFKMRDLCLSSHSLRRCAVVSSLVSEEHGTPGARWRGDVAGVVWLIPSNLAVRMPPTGNKIEDLTDTQKIVESIHV